MTTESASKLPQWYCAIDGRRRGPLEPIELKELADRGELSPDDLVWRDDYPDWVKASAVKGLFAAVPTMKPNAGRPFIQPTASGIATSGGLTSPVPTPSTTLQAGDGNAQGDQVYLLQQILASTRRSDRGKNLDEYTITEWVKIIAKIFIASLVFQILLVIIVVAVIALIIGPLIPRPN